MKVYRFNGLWVLLGMIVFILLFGFIAFFRLVFFGLFFILVIIPLLLYLFFKFLSRRRNKKRHDDVIDVNAKIKD